MSTVPIIAVIMPAYDAAATIAAAVASAQAQTVRAIEIVVVDDGSRDATAAIVAAAAQADGRIRLIRQPNAGPMAARNRAIAATTARYVAPLDADDLWHPEYLAAMLAALEAGGAGFAYALHHRIDASDRIIATPPTPHVSGAGFHRHLLVNFVGNGSAALFRRAALEGAGAYDERTRAWGGAEDYLLQLRIAADWPIACVPRRLVGYRRVAASLSDDPARMAAARKRAIATILRERGTAPLPAARWAAADADRAAAALLAGRGGVAPALAALARAAMADPAGTMADLAARTGNLWRRTLRPHAPADDPRFADAIAAVEPEAPLGASLDRRLRQLALLDARAPRPAHPAFDPPDENEPAVTRTPPIAP